jgi:hypothetical protein
MLDFFRAGGWSMFLVLALGVIGLVAAALFARRPDPSKVDAIKALTLAEILSVASGVTSDLSTVGYAIAEGKFPNAPLQQIAFGGFAESMSPAIMGFGLLTIVWLIMAVGYRRLRRTGGSIS